MADLEKCDLADKVETPSRTSKRKGSEWEILANLEKGVRYTIKPKRYLCILLSVRL